MLKFLCWGCVLVLCMVTGPGSSQTCYPSTSDAWISDLSLPRGDKGDNGVCNCDAFNVAGLLTKTNQISSKYVHVCSFT